MTAALDVLGSLYFLSLQQIFIIDEPEMLQQ